MITHSEACRNAWKGALSSSAVDTFWFRWSWQYTCTEDCVDQTGHANPIRHDWSAEMPLFLTAPVLPEHDCADMFATLELEPGQRVVLMLQEDSLPFLVRVRAGYPFPGLCPSSCDFGEPDGVKACDLEVGHRRDHRAERYGHTWNWS